ncbi:unnamed protein product [Amoebophrya sp. A25]|nr:unnamed protein product [Amoebophrya sp. A25]|eukprot:GSA25T00021667001.1
MLGPQDQQEQLGTASKSSTATSLFLTTGKNGAAFAPGSRSAFERDKHAKRTIAPGAETFSEAAGLTLSNNAKLMRQRKPLPGAYVRELKSLFSHGNFDTQYHKRRERFQRIDSRILALLEHCAGGTSAEAYIAQDLFFGKAVLDIGCGQGNCVFALAAFCNAKSVTGLDLDLNSIKTALKTLRSVKQNGLSFYEDAGLPDELSKTTGGKRKLDEVDIFQHGEGGPLKMPRVLTINEDKRVATTGNEEEKLGAAKQGHASDESKEEEGGEQKRFAGRDFFASLGLKKVLQERRAAAAARSSSSAAGVPQPEGRAGAEAREPNAEENRATKRQRVEKALKDTDGATPPAIAPGVFPRPSEDLLKSGNLCGAGPALVQAFKDDIFENLRQQRGPDAEAKSALAENATYPRVLVETRGVINVVQKPWLVEEMLPMAVVPERSTTEIEQNKSTTAPRAKAKQAEVMLIRRGSDYDFPYNMEFRTEDFTAETSVEEARLRAAEAQQWPERCRRSISVRLSISGGIGRPMSNSAGGPYDTILLFSVTKYVHLQRGDEGLRVLFDRVYRVLRPGGILVLEYHPISEYFNAKARKAAGYGFQRRPKRIKSKAGGRGTATSSKSSIEIANLDDVAKDGMKISNDSYDTEVSAVVARRQALSKHNEDLRQLDDDHKINQLQILPEEFKNMLCKDDRFGNVQTIHTHFGPGRKHALKRNLYLFRKNHPDEDLRL